MERLGHLKVNVHSQRFKLIWWCKQQSNSYLEQVFLWQMYQFSDIGSISKILKYIK